jgi:hypothetical protein
MGLPPIHGPQGRGFRAEWTTRVSRWGLVHRRPFPGPASAIWHTPDRPLPYVEGWLVPGSVAYNITP